MKNIDIITLGNGGFLRATAHAIPVEHFYKFVKFKRAVGKAYEAIGKAQADFLTEAGITLDDLNAGKADEAKMQRYGTLNAALLAEETPIDAKRIPVEHYKGLYDENGDLFASNPDIEAIVLDNLFKEEDIDNE